MVAALLRHPGPVCVGGAIRLELEVPPPRVCERHSIGESELDLGPVERPATVVWGANMTMWRAAFLTAGTFDERLLIGGEETEWERRLVAAGGRVIYAPDAWLLHRRMAADLTLASLLRRTFRRGLSCGRNTVHTGERQRYPEAAGRILGTFRTLVREVASERGVRVAKWLGDGCMAVGVEQLAVIEFVTDLERRAARVCAPLQLRAGVATGRALLFEGDDYIGSAVNMAARLCDYAQHVDVLMPTMHLDRMPEGVSAEPFGEIELRGFPGTIHVVRLTGVPVSAPANDTSDLWTRSPFT